jgi:hypothetical protein
VILGLVVSALVGGIAFVDVESVAIALAFVSAPGLGCVTPSLWAFIQTVAPLGTAGTWGGIQALAGGPHGHHWVLHHWSHDFVGR